MIRLLKILSILAIAGIVLLSLFTWYSCDDFCNRSELARYSIFRIAWLQYMNWDGRCLSIPSLVQLFCLKYFSVEATVFIWAISFVCSSILVFKIVQLENHFFFRGINSLVAITIVCVIMWLGMWKLVPDIIYWSTGGSYSLMNLLGLLWLFVFLKRLKSERINTSSCISVFFLALICGINSHNFLTGLIALCSIELGYYFFVMKNKRAAVFITYSLVALLIAAAIVFLAPGNKIRLSIISYQGYSAKFLYFYFLVFAKYIYWLLSLIVLCFFVIRLSGNKFLFRRKNFHSFKKNILNLIRDKQLLFTLLHRHKYMIAAMATIAMFSATAYFAVPRTSIFFATFIMIHFFQLGWKEETNINSKKFIYGSISLFCIFIGVIVFQMTQAYSIRKQLAMREKIFADGKEMNVTVSAIDKKTIPFSLMFTDITSDSSYWVNRCVANYYNLKTVQSKSE